MESRRATMAKASSRAGAPPPCSSLPEEIAIWEILVRLPAKSLLRCRAVCHAWRRATSARRFLLAHHACQPSLPIISGDIVSGSKHGGGARYENFLTLDHQAQLEPLVRLDASFNLESSCDGLLLLSKRGTTGTRLSICNPVTREHAPLVDFGFSSLLGMYMYRPTGEYRLLLHLWRSLPPKGEIGCCYISALGSDQPPRYIQGPEAPARLRVILPSRVRDSLHWFPWKPQSESRPVLVFDGMTELFRQMRAPVVSAKSDIFEMDDTLGIYSYNVGTEVVDIWVLQDYDSEVWKFKYRVESPVAEIMGRFERRENSWDVHAVSANGDVLLLVSHVGWMFYVNTDGELVDSFHHDGKHIFAWELRFKQTLVPHNFFTALEDYSVNTSPLL